MDTMTCNRQNDTLGGEIMIERKTGDIFAEDVEALVNSVNCVGVMGKGIALQFKKAFPENFKVYARRARGVKFSQSVCLSTTWGR